MLKDRRADRRLRRDGFVVLPLLSAADAAALRATHRELAGSGGTGFVADLNIDDPTYRAAADRAISVGLDRAAAGLFVDHEPFLRSFLAKHPGDDTALYLHRDWMYVDERQGSDTYVTWVALEDITGSNGQLRVVRGSHRLDDDLRGTDLNPPWMRHQDVLFERLLDVPVPAGSCIVFNNRLVHGSYPNHTDTPRLAAAVGLHRRGVPLVHFFREDDTTARRYDVDPEFFLTHSPGGLLQAPPSQPPSATVPIVEHDLTGEELAARIDRGWLATLDRRRARRNRRTERLARSTTE